MSSGAALPKEAVQAPDMSACRHADTATHGKTSMQKRSADFWPSVPLGVRVPGSLSECRICHALFFVPSGNLHRVMLCQM